MNADRRDTLIAVVALGAMGRLLWPTCRATNGLDSCAPKALGAAVSALLERAER